MSFSKASIARNLAEKKEKMLIDDSFGRNSCRWYHSQQHCLSLSHRYRHLYNHNNPNGEMQKGKISKGLMQETPLKFQGVRFNRSHGRCLMSEREELKITL